MNITNAIGLLDSNGQLRETLQVDSSTNQLQLNQSQISANLLFVKAPAPTPGVSSAYGTAVVDSASTNKGIVPIAVSMTVGGTVGTSETVTLEIIVTFSDATTATVTHAFTATGSYQLTQAEITSLTKDAVYITQTSVASMSSLTATSATTSANITALSV